MWDKRTSVHASKMSDYIANPIKKVLSVRIYLPAGTDIICQVLDIIDVILRDIISPTSKSRGWFVLKKVSCIFHQTMLECSLRSGSCMYLWGKTKVTGWALSTNSGDLMLSWNSNRIYYRPSNVQETRPSKMDNSTGIYKKKTNNAMDGLIKNPLRKD